MAKKTKIKLEDEAVPALLLSDSYHLSGADMEALLTRAKFEAVAHGKDSVDLAMLEQVIKNFIPPTYPEEVELQTLLAVLECTSKKLLPDLYTQMDRQELLSRIEELRFRIA